MLLQWETPTFKEWSEKELPVAKTEKGETEGHGILESKREIIQLEEVDGDNGGRCLKKIRQKGLEYRTLNLELQSSCWLLREQFQDSGNQAKAKLKWTSMWMRVRGWISI